MEAKEACSLERKGTVADTEAVNNTDRSGDLVRKIFSTRSVMIDSKLGIVRCHVAMRNRAEARQRARVKDPKSQDEASLVRPVGLGSCGVIYEESGMTHVFKRAINHNTALSVECRLVNDFVAHRAIEEAFNEVEHAGYAPPVLVPHLYSYVTRRDDICELLHARLFAKGEQSPEDLLISERIPAIHLIARQALIDLYCPTGQKAGARAQDSNDDCLVRLYLGKRRDATKRLRPRQFFGLRNFPLCLDQMQELHLETKHYALAMAEALAIMHWKVKIDAADVEFVLGGQPHPDRKADYRYEQALGLRDPHPITPAVMELGLTKTHMWMLDFNQCQPMQEGEAGVDQAVKRFFDNDPYYPRPPAYSDIADLELWEDFANRYLVVSGRFVGATEQALPGLFIEKIKIRNSEKLRERAEAAQRSGKSSDFEAEEYNSDCSIMAQASES